MHSPRIERLRSHLERLSFDPSHCVHRHLSRTARQVAAAFDDAFATHALTASQFTTLMTVARTGPLTIGRLATELAIDTTTVPRLVRPLIERGEIAMQRGTDRRQRVITVTDAGIERLVRALPVWERVQRTLLSSLSAEKWPQIRHDIAALRHHARSSGRTRASSPPAKEH